MSNLKIFSEDLKVSNKRIIVRLDLNVPINNFKIEDNTRIKIICLLYTSDAADEP